MACVTRFNRCIYSAQVCARLNGRARGEWIHARVRSVLHGGTIARGNTTAVQHTEHKHEQATRTQRHTVHTWTHSWRRCETEERQYFMRQESGLQSTAPASSYLVGSLLETRANQCCQVKSVKKHRSLNWAHAHTRTVYSFLLFLPFKCWNVAISTGIMGLFHHLRQKCFKFLWSFCNTESTCKHFRLHSCQKTWTCDKIQRSRSPQSLIIRVNNETPYSPYSHLAHSASLHQQPGLQGSIQHLTTESVFNGQCQLQ